MIGKYKTAPGRSERPARGRIVAEPTDGAVIVTLLADDEDRLAASDVLAVDQTINREPSN